MSTWYEPEHTWPEHDKSHWRKPMAEAQDAGWSLEYIDAPHTFGWVHCPEKQHKFKIDKTATGSQFWAAEASKIITRKCRHGSARGTGKVRARLEQARSTLESASIMFDAVEADLILLETIADSWERALRLEQSRDRLLLQMATAELTLSGLDDAPLAEGMEEDVVELDGELEAELSVLGQLQQGPQPHELRSRLDEAEAVVAEVENLATKMSRRKALADSVRAGIAIARARHLDLVARLEVLEGPAPTDS